MGLPALESLALDYGKPLGSYWFAWQRNKYINSYIRAFSKRFWNKYHNLFLHFWKNRSLPSYVYRPPSCETTTAGVLKHSVSHSTVRTEDRMRSLLLFLNKNLLLLTSFLTFRSTILNFILQKYVKMMSKWILTYSTSFYWSTATTVLWFYAAFNVCSFNEVFLRACVLLRWLAAIPNTVLCSFSILNLHEPTKWVVIQDMLYKTVYTRMFIQDWISWQGWYLSDTRNIKVK